MVDPLGPGRPSSRTLEPLRIDPLAGLAADAPIVLLPVRIETRWFDTADHGTLELRIRVYPDEIHVAAPPSASRAERADVAAYYALLASDGEAAPTTRARYAQLVERHGSSRATWLVRALAPGAPAIPDAERDDPASAMRVAALPHHWIAVATAPSFRAVAEGKPIAADLAAAPVPKDAHDDPTSPALGNALAWITSFTAAEEAGMALRLTMARAQAERLEELIVVGVGAQDPDAAGAVLGELLSRHASSSGAALLPWGTPTNTTGNRDAARAAGEPGAWSGPGDRPLAALGSTPTGDAARTLAALGVDADHGRDIVADGLDREAITHAMHTALWPATWGYYLAEMAAQKPKAVAEARSLYVDHVRPLGPFPTLRVRAQPYGLLPATSLQRWPATAERGGLAAFLTRAEKLVDPAVAHVPRLVDSTDVDRDLVAVLRRLPASRGAWVREATDAETAAVSLGGNPLAWLDTIRAQLDQLARAVVSAQLGLPATMKILDLVFDDSSALLGIPFVAPTTAPPEAPLAKDYVSALATASASDIAAHRIEGADPRTLLYLLARHATTLIRLTSLPPAHLGVATTLHPVRVVRDHRTPATTAAPTPATVWNRLDAGHAHAFANPAVVAHQRALRTLGAAPVGELQRALAGVIDSCAYRLDSWATALASERLTALRSARPRASHVGGWAWLEKPRPTPRPTPGGFVHAPSMAQARTAAVLRAGYEAHRTDGLGTTLEVDLSSERVRAARWLLDGMRDGRPLGRLLGDHLERWLVAHGHPELIQTLRQASVPDGTPPSDLADGWALYQQWTDHAPSGPTADAFADVRALLDAVADLLLAESVHQALAGSPARAGAALDALEHGEIATPDPQVDRTATEGRRVERRVALLLGPAPGWPGGPRPRAAAAPELEGVAARVLGEPAAVTIDVSIERDGHTSTVHRTLADLDLCALDAVLLAADGERGFLDRAAASAAAGGGTVRATTGGPALDELVLKGAALARLLRGAHAPRAGDLGAVEVHEASPPSSTEPPNDVGLDTLARPSPIGALTSLVTVDESPARLASWLADMARVRPALEPLDLLALVAPDLFRGERRRTAAGVELALYSTTTAPTAALIVDGWSEAPPAREITTGAAFPFDAPRAQPPQAVLLAVPPPTASWSLGLLEAIVRETMTRAKQRMISPYDVRGQVAPTMLVADDRDDLVPSIDLSVHAVILEELHS